MPGREVTFAPTIHARELIVNDHTVETHLGRLWRQCAVRAAGLGMAGALVFGGVFLLAKEVVLPYPGLTMQAKDKKEEK